MQNIPVAININCGRTLQPTYSRLEATVVICGVNSLSRSRLAPQNRSIICNIKSYKKDNTDNRHEDQDGCVLRPCRLCACLIIC